MTKFMITVLSLVLAGFAAQAQNQESYPARMVDQQLSFPISSINGFDRIYYNCDSVEQAAEGLLADMGAYNIRAHCTGGIESGSISPEAFLTVRFTNATVVDKAADATHQAAYVPTRLDGRETNSGVTRGYSCHLANEIFRNTRDSFDLQNVSASFHCSGFSRSYRVEFSALRAL